MAVVDSRRRSRWQRPGTAISNYPNREKNNSHLPRNAVHLAQDSSEKGTLSAADRPDNGG